MHTGVVSSSQTSYLFRTSSAVTKDRSATPSTTLPRSSVITSSQVSISKKALAVASKTEHAGAPHDFDFTTMSQNELHFANGELVELTPTERASAGNPPKNSIATLKEQLDSNIASPDVVAFYKKMDADLSKISISHD